MIDAGCSVGSSDRNSRGEDNSGTRRGRSFVPANAWIAPPASSPLQSPFVAELEDWVIYKNHLYRRGIPYAFSLELLGEDGGSILVDYGDPELVRMPSPAQLQAALKRKKR